MKRKLLALLLLFGLCVCCFPMTALAAEPAGAESEEENVLSADEAAWADIKALMDAEEYDEAIDQAEAYMRSNQDSPVYDKVEKTCIQSYVRKARVLIEKKHREDAQDLLEECADRYADSEFLYIVEKDQEALKQLLKKEIPKSGQIFHKNSTVFGGNSQLTIKNSGSKLLVKIELASGKNKGEYITMFVRPNASATVKLKAGNYILKFASGDTWYSSTEWFGSDMYLEKIDKVYDFDDWYIWTITLGATNGNVGSTSISRDEF